MGSGERGNFGHVVAGLRTKQQRVIDKNSYYLDFEVSSGWVGLQGFLHLQGVAASCELTFVLP